ncbi:hypothetical protein QR680_006081 [Steinernema hermaphroditum]|uniref:Uncharacterized protein n=1 Tax=Steinernema hermaphroditum TaxID=289476 RepID=A0AA39LWS6_9BILA|nr:hypothetical protein QR680_006081 [Steinernema hermaphroditum]
MKRNVMSMRFWLLLSLLICYAVANSSPDSLSRKRVKHRNVNYNNPLTIGLICGIVAYWAVAVPTLIVLYLKCCDPRKIRDIDMNNRYSHRQSGSESEESGSCEDSDSRSSKRRKRSETRCRRCQKRRRRNSKPRCKECGRPSQLRGTGRRRRSQKSRRHRTSV